MDLIFPKNLAQPDFYLCDQVYGSALSYESCLSAMSSLPVGAELSNYGVGPQADSVTLPVTFTSGNQT